MFSQLFFNNETSLSNTLYIVGSDVFLPPRDQTRTTCRPLLCAGDTACFCVTLDKNGWIRYHSLLFERTVHSQLLAEAAALSTRVIVFCTLRLR